MTVKELRRLLSKFPKNEEVYFTCECQLFRITKVENLYHLNEGTYKIVLDGE